MQEPTSSPTNPESSFDFELAKSYIGKILLFGITYCDHDGHVLSQTQNFGEIVEINQWMLTIKLQGTDEIFTLPLFVAELESAPEGEYKLRSTGQVVVNPDLIGRFQVFEAKRED